MMNPSERSESPMAAWLLVAVVALSSLAAGTAVVEGLIDVAAAAPASSVTDTAVISQR